MNSNQAEGRTALVALVDKNFDKLRQALPKNVDPARFRLAAVMAASENPKILLECTPISVFSAILQAAQMGYNLGSTYNEAYLIPYRDKRAGVTVCKLTPGYVGMRRALIRSGAADVIHASIVHQHDHCIVSHHPPSVKHEIDLKGERGEWLGVLACAYRLKDGVHQLIDFEYLSEARILAARAQSRDTSLWDKHPEQFWKKTGVRALVKLFPLVNDELVQMVSWDNESTDPLQKMIDQPEPPVVDAPHAPQDVTEAFAIDIKGNRVLPEPGLIAPPPESPQAAQAKKKTRKKRAAKKTKPANGQTEVPSFGFSS